MKELGLAIEGGVLLGCLWSLLVLAVGCLIYHIASCWRIWKSSRCSAVMSAAAVVAIIVGGTKPIGPLITWDEGLHDNGSFIDTNDLRRVEVRWTYESWIPSVATFTLSAVEKDTVNPDPASNRLFTVATVPVTNLALSAIMEHDATNYLFFAEQSFIPDAPVVTNGVYHIKCVGGENVWVPIGLKIYGDSELISPPAESFVEDLMKGNLQ